MDSSIAFEKSSAIPITFFFLMKTVSSVWNLTESYSQCSKFYNVISWRGSVFKHCIGHLVCPFNLESYNFQFWEFFLDYFFSDFLPSVFSVFSVFSGTSIFQMLDILERFSNYLFIFWVQYF